MTAVNVICLFIIVSMLLILLLEKTQGRLDDKLKTEKMETEKLVFLFLIYGLIVIRCIGLGDVPGGINQDGAMGAVDAFALAQYGTDRFGTWLPAHLNAWGYGQMSVLLSYLTVPFIKIWGMNSLTIRLPMVIVSLLGSMAVYVFVKKMISPKAALVVLMFLAINPWHFMQSRWALDCNVFPHMFIIGTCLLIKGLKNNKYLYLAMIFYALCMYSYGVSFYMIPFFLLMTCALLFENRYISIKQVIICIAVYFGISFPIYGTMAINFFKWDTVSLPFVTMPYFKDSIRSNDILFFSEHPVKQLFLNLGSLINVVFLQKPDLIWNAIDDFGTMYLCSMPFILMGIGITIYLALREADKDKRIICKILLIYWGCSILVGICINSVNVNRVNIIFYSHIIFAGIAIYYMIKKWKRTAFALLIIYSLQSALFFDRYFTLWADEMENVFYADFLDAVEFSGDLACDYYYITPDTQYTGSANVSEILTMFILNIDAEYYQGKTNHFKGADISYAERYHFYNPSQEEVNTWSKTAYVIKTDDLIYYDANQFAIKRFNNYSVVVPLEYANW